MKINRWNHLSANSSHSYHKLLIESSLRFTSKQKRNNPPSKQLSTRHVKLNSICTQLSHVDSVPCHSHTLVDTATLAHISQDIPLSQPHSSLSNVVQFLWRIPQWENRV